MMITWNEEIMCFTLCFVILLRIYSQYLGLHELTLLLEQTLAEKNEKAIFYIRMKNDLSLIATLHMF